MTNPPSQLRTAKVVLRLPRRYLEAIGLVVANWARLETELLSTAYLLLRLDKKRGRLIYSPNRAHEIVNTISDLLGLEAVSVTSVDLKKLEGNLKTLKSRRDLVAHSIWLHGPKRTYMVQSTAGAVSINGTSVKRKVRPEGIPATPNDLHALADDVFQATLEAVRLRQELQEKLSELRQEHP